MLYAWGCYFKVNGPVQREWTRIRCTTTFDVTVKVHPKSLMVGNYWSFKVEFFFPDLMTDGQDTHVLSERLVVVGEIPRDETLENK